MAVTLYLASAECPEREGDGLPRAFARMRPGDPGWWRLTLGSSTTRSASGPPPRGGGGAAAPPHPAADTPRRPGRGRGAGGAPADGGLVAVDRHEPARIHPPQHRPRRARRGLASRGGGAGRTGVSIGGGACPSTAGAGVTRKSRTPTLPIGRPHGFGAAGWTTISTRRLFARPSAEALSAMGRVRPNHCDVTRSAAIPRPPR